MSKRETFLDPVKEALAVKGLRESLAAVDADDEALLLDTVEGETQLFEITDALLERMAEAEGMIAGIDAMVAKFNARKARFAHRIEADRTLIEQAFSIAELKTVVRPTATLSLSTRAPSLQITEESDIPAEWWRPGTPSLDKKGLAAALKERAKAISDLPEDEEARTAALAALPPEIPGATLTNGAPSITIRRA